MPTAARQMHPPVVLTERATNVRMPEDLYEAVRRYAFENRISLAEAMRLALINLVGWRPGGGASRRAEAKRSKR